MSWENQNDGLCDFTRSINQSQMAGVRTTGYAVPIMESTQSSYTTAAEITSKAAALVGGDREKQHGDKVENHQNIAELWNAYLGWRLGGSLLTPKDVALMMVLLKVARTKAGSHNPDDYVDAAGYAAVAGEIAERQR